MWQYTTEGNRRANEGVQLFVTSNGELQVTWRDALDLEILRSVSGKLEDFGGEVFQHGGEVDGSFGTDASLLAGDATKVALYATAWELYMTQLVPRLNLSQRVVVARNCIERVANSMHCVA